MKKAENKQLTEDINGLKNRLNELESLFLESHRQKTRLLVGILSLSSLSSLKLIITNRLQ